MPELQEQLLRSGKKFGFNPTIIEVAPKLREGGYAIDFMGAGYDVAEKMDIVGKLKKVDIDFSKPTFVDKNNKEKGSIVKLKWKIGLMAESL